MNRRESLRAIGGIIACGLVGIPNDTVSGCLFYKRHYFLTMRFSQEVVFLGGNRTQTVFKVKAKYLGKGKLTNPDAWKDYLAFRLIEGPFERVDISVDRTGKFLDASFTQIARG